MQSTSPKEMADISREDVQIMYHARKSLLFSNEKPWMKRKENLFDVTMGAYDGARSLRIGRHFYVKSNQRKMQERRRGFI